MTLSLTPNLRHQHPTKMAQNSLVPNAWVIAVRGTRGHSVLLTVVSCGRGWAGV